MAGVVIIGMLTWWRPGYLMWGALIAALAVVYTLWLIWRTSTGDRSVPGHLFHLVVLGPAAVLAWHTCFTGLSAERTDPSAVSGALNASMIFQLALLSLGVMLAQSLLPRAACRFGVLSVCGAAMMGGAAAAMIWGRAEAGRSALAILGFAGVCVWLAPLWGVLRQDDPEQPPHPLRRLSLRVICVAVAASGAGVLACVAPHEALLATGVVGATVFLAGLVFRRRRIILLVVGGFLAVAAAIAARLARSPVMSLEWIPVDWFGRGEKAFGEVYAGSSGLAILARAVGWSGLTWLVVGLAACTVWLMWHARKGHPGDRGRAVVWTSAAALAGCAMLAPAGPFIPAVTLAAALTWGLLPTMLGREPRGRPGALLLAGLLALMLLQGLARKGGLLSWGAAACGWSDSFLHAAAGLLLAMTLSWYMGARNTWLGVLGLALAVLGGGVGELAQGLLSARGAELSDWVAHSLGVAVALPVYLLAVGSRWCESPDAAPKADCLDPARPVR